MGSGVWGSGFSAWGSGFRGSSVGFRVEGFSFRGFRVWGDTLTAASPPMAPCTSGASCRQKPERKQMVFFNCLDFYLKSPDSGERQYKSRTWMMRFDPTPRAGGKPLRAAKVDFGMST